MKIFHHDFILIDSVNINDWWIMLIDNVIEYRFNDKH